MRKVAAVKGDHGSTGMLGDVELQEAKPGVSGLCIPQDYHV